MRRGWLFMNLPDDEQVQIQLFGIFTTKINNMDCFRSRLSLFTSSLTRLASKRSESCSNLVIARRTALEHFLKLGKRWNAGDPYRAHPGKASKQAWQTGGQNPLAGKASHIRPRRWRGSVCGRKCRQKTPTGAPRAGSPGGGLGV